MKIPNTVRHPTQEHAGVNQSPQAHFFTARLIYYNAANFLRQ